MPDRRRWRDVSGARFDTARRLALALWPFAASLAAVALLLASVVVSVRAIRDRERLEELAAEVKRSADNAAEASAGNRALLESAKPCLVDDPPDSPACVRKAASDKVVADAIARINESLAAGLAAHDANAGRDHAAIQSRLGVRSALPPRTPITAAPRPTTATTAQRPATVAPAPSPAPVTTTTTCPKLPNGKCRR